MNKKIILISIFNLLIVMGIYSTSGLMVSMMYLLGTLVGTFFGYEIYNEKTPTINKASCEVKNGKKE